jgi:septum formation protein
MGPSVSSLPVRLVLASASPRRADLLRAAGFAFVVRPASVDESAESGEDARALVRRVASAKAAAVQPDDPGEVILAADTIVVLDGSILGKPRDDRDAAAMLARLSGRSHLVLTGVAVRQASRLVAHVEETRVHFAELSENEIAWYVASGEPRDKAGAYGIQGLASRFVTRLEGSYTNVVGLPVAALHRMLKTMRPVEKW